MSRKSVGLLWLPRAELVLGLRKLHGKCANRHEHWTSGHLLSIAGGPETGSTELVACRTMRADVELARVCAILH
jgi:hypothetical protein